MSTNKNKRALIVVDVQNYFVNSYTESISDKIASFVKKNKFDFALFTKFVNTKNSNFFKLLNWKKCSAFPDIDIHKTLKPFVKKDNLFTKSSYSIFKSRKLVKLLKANKINQIFLCGLDIDSCVLASAFEGFDLGYEIHIIKDLSSSHSGKILTSAALKIVKKNFEK